MAALVALLWLGTLGLSGVLALRRWTALGALERWTYGAPLGVVVGSLLLVPLAGWLSLGPLSVTLVALASLLSSWALRVGAVAPEPGPEPSRIGPGVALVLAAFVARWAWLAATTLTHDATGLWAGHINVWGDWSQHLGDVSSMVYGGNIPPTHPRLAGTPLSYHYLTSITAAAMVSLGLTPAGALQLHTFVFLSFATFALFAFARRFTRDAAAGALATILFLVGGGWGFERTVTSALGAEAPWTAFLADPWDHKAQMAGNYRWLNTVFAYLLPQRGTLYGLPLGLFCLTQLFEGVQSGARRPFLIAGVAAGLLPLAHLGTMLSLALLTPFLIAAFPRIGWLAFLATWIPIALPMLLFQQGGAPGALSHLRFHAGWVAAPDPWVVFWIKNLGVFAPLLVVAALHPRLVAGPARTFLLAFMPLFAIANLVQFQPWDWDNTKILLYWYVAACVLVAALVAKLWRRGPLLVRAALALAVVSLLASGLLAHLDQAMGRDRYRILTADEVRFGEELRRVTEPDAVLVTGFRHNHPVTVLSGRQVVMGYPGWLWSQGYPYRRRERDVKAMLELTRRAPGLFARYGVDYVVIGPDERESLRANDAGFRARHPLRLEVGPYALYEVRRRRASPPPGEP